MNVAMMIPQRSLWDTVLPNLTILGIAIAAFLGVIFLIFVLAERASNNVQNILKYIVFLAPAALLLLIGLIYPAIRTLIFSFMNANSSEFVGFDNYTWAFTIPEIRIVLRNTLIWTLLVPILSTGLGLAIAYMTDRMKRAAVIKSLIFMPMAISFVGAGIIWRFVYTYEANVNRPEIGLLSSIWRAMEWEPRNWLLEAPLNTLLLIVVMVWIQTGFAMVVLSAAMRNIPDEITEAALLDGTSNFRRFTRITIPMIRATIVVVLTTITIGTLKVFDIVRTMTGGNFQTNVIANEMYSQSFRQMNYGTGSALAIILFVAIIPIIIYNVRQLRLERTER
ncbi:unannotated protein [freshwater metagenome]|uniref:Unannotated protein n=1 Tax=freshwater metagenome TaxID=449393 RepID=A0A6J6DWG0_9ZZZZ